MTQILNPVDGQHRDVGITSSVGGVGTVCGTPWEEDSAVGMGDATQDGWHMLVGTGSDDSCQGQLELDAQHRSLPIGWGRF